MQLLGLATAAERSMHGKGRVTRTRRHADSAVDAKGQKVFCWVRTSSLGKWVVTADDGDALGSQSVTPSVNALLESNDVGVITATDPSTGLLALLID